MLDKSGLDLCRRKPVAGDVDHIVDTSANPIVALVITACAISRELPQSALVKSLDLTALT